jgi:hypothetical protein
MNCMTGAMLLTALALADDNLLRTLRKSQILQRVELSLHSCKIFAVQDDIWLPALHAVEDLQQVQLSFQPIGTPLLEPYSEEHVLSLWCDISSEVKVIREKLG